MIVRRPFRTTIGALCLVAVSITASACSSGSTSTSSRSTDERLAIVPVAGCENAWSDPTDLSPTRAVSRCAPNTPAPRPLSSPVALTVSIPAKMEFAAPQLLAKSMGEFAKENLDVTFVTMPGYDAAPQLAQGMLDASVGGYEVSFFNAERIGLPVRAVIGNYFPLRGGDLSSPQSGLWCRRSSFSDPANPDIAETQDMTWATGVGKASVAFFYSAEQLMAADPGFDPARVRTVMLPPSDTASGLANGAVDCASLIDPVWADFTGGDYIMVATQPPAEPMGYVLFGKNLLQDSPAVGDAFVRAIVRTINTYLSGDYHQDPVVMAQLASDMNLKSPDFMKKSPSLVFDWELRSSTPDRIQRMMIGLNAIATYETPIPESHLIDRSYYEHAVGHVD